MVGGSMTEYNLDWLKEKGFFRKSIPLEVKGKEILVDEKNLLAYVEVFSNEEIEEIKKELLSQKVRYIWFFFPPTGKLKVFRRIGEIKWFYYSDRIRRKEFKKSREDKLNKFSPNNMNILFDIRDIVEKFYWQLWEHRILMARSIKELKEDKNKLLVVQHLIDRLIFFYFLAQLGLIRIKNEEREWVLDRKRTREFFKWICSQLSEENLQKFLNKIFFDVLGQVKESGFVSEEFVVGGESFSIVSPCLNGGLFVEEKIEGIPERKIRISGIGKLILEVLNNYNWIIGEEFPEEEDVIGDLTPEIIGHIYEKFVVSLEQIGIGKINLEDIKTVKEELKYGRKKIGAYYTPEEITNYISMKTIYPYIRDKLKEKFGKDGEVLLFKKDNFNKQELEMLKYLYFEILTKIKICDNACGSGSFLIAAGRVLLPIYKKVLEILEKGLGDDRDVKEVLSNIKKSPTRNYYIVRQIIVNNLYGVDIMEGAVEIAKLRFWLWLISQVDPKKIEGKRIETLPNLDFNLMVGNSLIGFVDIEDADFPIEIERKTKKARWISLRERYYPLTEFSKEGKIDRVSWLKRLTEQKQKFKTLPAHEAIKLKEKLNKELERAREFLNEKFYNMLKAKGIKISKEEFLELKPFHWGFEFYEVFDLEKPKEERGFDIIIGNPPYVENKKMNQVEKDILKRNYVSAYKLFDYAVIFIERSYQLLKRNGFFSYIVTNKFVSTDYGVKLREYILKNTELRELLDVSHIEVFKGIATYPIIIVFKKVPQFGRVSIGTNITDEFQIGSKAFERVYIPQKKFLETPGYIFDISGNLLLCEKIRSNRFSQPLGKICNFFYRILGFTNWVEILKFVVKEKPKGECLKFIGTANITPFVIDSNIPLRVAGKEFKNCYLKFSPSFSKETWNIFKKEKLLIKEVAKVLTTAYDKGEYANLTGMYMVIPKTKISLFYLLGLLNSKLLNFYFNSLYGTTHMAGGYLRFNGSYLKELPIYISKNEKEIFVIKNISEYIYTLKFMVISATIEKEGTIIQLIYELKKLLDTSIYELYFKEKFKQDGIKTNLLELVEPYLKDISTLNSDEEKLETIKKVVEKIKNDKKITEQIEKIKSHHWVKVIEGEER